MKDAENFAIHNESAESRLSKITEKNKGFYNDVASIPTPLKGSRKSTVNKTPTLKEAAPNPMAEIKRDTEEKRSLSNLNKERIAKKATLSRASKNIPKKPVKLSNYEREMEIMGLNNWKGKTAKGASSNKTPLKESVRKEGGEVSRIQSNRFANNELNEPSEEADG
jgi:hypothetical protein